MDGSPSFSQGALSLGDRLVRIEGKIDSLAQKMETFAEEGDVRALRSRIDLIERNGSVPAQRAEAQLATFSNRLVNLETSERLAEAARTSRRWFIGSLIALGSWASVLAGIVIFAIGYFTRVHV